jgi:integrase/recombinase XerC
LFAPSSDTCAPRTAPRTVAAYLIGVRQADKFLRAHSTAIQTATRADLEAFMGDLLSRRAPSTAATYYKVLKILYAWLVEEEIAANPMARMKPPIVPDKPVSIVPEDGLKRPLRVCAGNTFEARPRHRPHHAAAAGHRRPPRRDGRPHP